MLCHSHWQALTKREKELLSEAAAGVLSGQLHPSQLAGLLCSIMRAHLNGHTLFN